MSNHKDPTASAIKDHIPSPAPQFLLLGGDLQSNMGDRCIRAALIHLIRSSTPEARFVCWSKTPERDTQDFGVEVVGSNGFSLLTGFRKLRRVDGVIWGGGQLLQDDTSLLKNMYWAVVLGWVRWVLRKPIIGVGVGIGPLQRRAGIFFARSALLNLSGCVARDPESLAWIESLTRKRVPAELAVDMALFLPPAPDTVATNYLRQTGGPSPAPDEIVIGVAVRRWFHLKRNPILPYQWHAWLRRTPAADNDHMETFIQELSTALRRFGEAHKVRLLFFPMARMAWESDVRLSEKIAAQSGLPSHVLPMDCDPATVKALTASCTIMVTMRMHAAILAAGMHVPPITLSHTPKSVYFHQILGLEDWVLDMQDLSVPGGGDAIYRMLNRAIADHKHLTAHLTERIAELNRDKDCYARILRHPFRT